MSGQILELIIFAGVAFFIINKLIATLGKTSDDDPSKNRSFFGENAAGKLKDVTYTNGSGAAILRPKFLRSNKINLKGLILTENKEIIEEGLKELLIKMPTFNIERFLTGAKAAFTMVIEAALSNDSEKLEELIDKRYVDKFKSSSEIYGDLSKNSNELSAQVSEIYTFGNNVFVKILFSGKNITKKLKDLHEEWTFSKSALSPDPAWHLTNVDRI